MSNSFSEVTLERENDEDHERDVLRARTRDADNVEYTFKYIEDGQYRLDTWVISSIAEDKDIHTVGSDELERARRHVENTLVERDFLDEEDAVI